MIVKSDIFQFEFLFVTVPVDEGGFELTLSPRLEMFDFYLFRKIHAVRRHSLVDGLLGAPVDCQLLILPVVVKIFYLIIGQRLLLDNGKVPVKTFDVNADILVVIEDDRNVFPGVGDAYVGHAVLEIRLPVVVVAEVDLLAE